MRNEYSASRWSKKARSSTASERESWHFADSIKGNDAVADCVLNQFCSALHAKPFQNIGAVGFGGSNRNLQHRCHLFRRTTTGDQPQDFLLPRRQWLW